MDLGNLIPISLLRIPSFGLPTNISMANYQLRKDTDSVAPTKKSWNPRGTRSSGVRFANQIRG